MHNLSIIDTLSKFVLEIDYILFYSCIQYDHIFNFKSYGIKSHHISDFSANITKFK